jgi:ribonuclease Z
MSTPLAEFVHGGLRLVGSSVAGEESVVIAPELDLAFDFGRAPREIVSIDHVFLTHGHMDHAAGLAYYFAQRMFVDNPPGHLYVPGYLVEPVRRLLRVWADIDGHEPPAHLHPVEAGVDVPLRRDLVVRPFEVNHPCRRADRTVAPALGYAAIEVRQKLIPEYQGLTGPQIVELKRQGVEITRRLEIPLVAYCGDTAVGPFLELDCVRRAKVLLLECTFVEPEQLDRARAGNHMHVRDLPAILPRLANEQILLTHLTRRTALAEARTLLKRELGEAWDERLSFFMEHRPRSRHRPRADAGPAVETS